MKIAIAQLNYHIGNFAENTSKIIEYIGKSKAEGAELVVFTELSVTGYYPHDLLERKEFIEQSEEALNRIAAHCNGIAAIVGGPRINSEPRGKKLFNSAFFMYNGAIQQVVNKSLLPTYDISSQTKRFRYSILAERK
jgi:NAD+ synthase (glutamine-hydrolysing)